VGEKGFLVPLVVEECKERLEFKRLAGWEKVGKMRRVRLGFTCSPGRDTIVVAESVSKYGHPGLRGTSPSHTSAELPHVGHRSKIFESLIERNKLVQQDGNHGPFVNQNIICRELSKTVQGCVPFFHPKLMRRLTTEPNNIFLGTRDINPFLSKMPEDPNAL
jgi:hypothetical protein